MDRLKSISLKPWPLFVPLLSVSSFLSCLFFLVHLHIPTQVPKTRFPFDQSSLSLDLQTTHVEIFTSVENVTVSTVFTNPVENIFVSKDFDSSLGDTNMNTSVELSEESTYESLVSKEGEGINKKEETRDCDIYSGKWVFEESYPLYSSTSCPFIDEGFRCDGNGRKDKDYMKWRWKPNGCEIPRFSGVNMLELIKGKRLVFVGDSINRNQWESMLCLLVGAVKDPKRVFEAHGRRITKDKGNYKFKFVDYGCSVEFYVSHFLVQESKAKIGKKRVQTLRIDTMEKSSSKWKGADILVFNTAHWWSHSKTRSGKIHYQEGDQVHRHKDVLSAFKRALLTWGSWVDENAIHGKMQVFFRSSAPAHFSGGLWNTGGRCDLETQPLTNITSVADSIDDHRVAIAHEVISRMKTPVSLLNITSLSKLRPDAHPSIYGLKPGTRRTSSVQDCSHWCLPGVPDTWNELLYYLLLSKQRPDYAK